MCLGSVALVALAARAPAQTTLVEYQLAGSLGEVGSNVADAGDIDGDGLHDLLVGGSTQAGSILLTYSGADGTLLPGSFPVAGAFGIGDLNGDGQRDVVAGALLALIAYSRATGAPLWAVENESPSNSGGRNACVLVPNPVGPFLLFPVAANASGVFSISAPNPASVFTGFSLWHQFWFADAAALAGVSATNGMKEILK